MTFNEFQSNREAVNDIGAVCGFDLNEDGSLARGFVYAPDSIGGWVWEANHPTLGRYHAQIERDEVWSDDLETVERAVYEWAVVACGI